MTEKVRGRKALLFVITVALSLSAVCCIAMQRKAGDDTMTLGKQDSGRQIKLSVGDTFRVELEAIAGTGYWWYLDDLDTVHLELLSEETKVPSEEGKTGGPVTLIRRFKAIKKGDSGIVVDYYRKWEGLESSTAHFEVKIAIK